MSIFPGEEITANKTDIISIICNNLYLDNIKKSTDHWVKVDEKVYKSDVLANYEIFYIFYNHPVHDYLNKLFLTDKEKLIDFMKERINCEREEGIDIIVTPKDFSKMIICNHDGEIYLAGSK